MTDKTTPLCSHCPSLGCFKGDLSQAPENCPTIHRASVLKQARAILEEPENQALAQRVARTWKNYGQATRVEETVLYARLSGARKLGLAFCAGLAPEARLFTNILVNEGFEPISVACMCGALSSEDINLPTADKITPHRQPMCNPIGQAAILKAEETELNILLGLCVGDDTLFIKHSAAPVTVLAVKDRVLAHNPLAALYTSATLFTRLKTRPPKPRPEP